MDPTQQGQQPVQQPVAQPVAQPVPVQPVQQPAAQPPVDTSREKTREQFEKLLESNRKLFEANEALRQELQTRQVTNQVFKPVEQTPRQPAQQPQVDVSDLIFTDPNTGEQMIDQNKLASRIRQAEQEASKANQAVQNYIQAAEKREIEKQNREALSAYPELNPNDGTKFDATFSREVRAALVDSMYNPDDYGGRPLSFKEAADFVRQQNPKSQAPTPTQAEVDAAKAQAAAAGQELKQQGSATVTSQPQIQPQQQETDAEIQALRARTRFGDDRALAERLKYTQHILPRDAQVV